MKHIIALLFAITAMSSFGFIIFQPIWNYSTATLNTSLLFLLGWTAATLANKFYVE